ncbi:ATP-binding cassette domain-containing protein [Herpetosiphon sp. NSE202]|uniref:ATP-binding cassette domain-containing protein n=1 Tax=Herpetosiphon sp. NSE202 TaxID=3351349 RepID=UPI003632D98E
MDIQIKHLVKQYGSYRALDDISLSIGAGMFGLLGPNGAGKTTFMRILTTQLVPTSGEVVVGGVDVEREPSTIRQQLGYLPQEFGFYQSLSAFAMLDYVDEPTVGLDPEERIRFRNVLARIAGQRTVVLSTHIVADIEASCSGVAVLRRGKLLFSGPPAELVQAATGRVWQVVVSSAEWERLTQQLQVISSRPLGAQLLARVVSAENPFGRGELVEGTLEDGYMAVMAQGVAHA